MFKMTWKDWKPTVVCLVFAFISFLALLQKPASLPRLNTIALAAIAVFVTMAIYLLPWQKKN